MTLRICLCVFISIALLSGQQREIEVLPNPDVIYKLQGDIGFEDLNFGPRIDGIEIATNLSQLIFIYYRDKTELTRRAMNVEMLDPFLKKQGEDGILRHSFQEYLPSSANVDELEVRLVLRNGDVE